MNVGSRGCSTVTFRARNKAGRRQGAPRTQRLPDWLSHCCGALGSARRVHIYYYCNHSSIISSHMYSAYICVNMLAAC
jgi:hypothetical protein